VTAESDRLQADDDDELFLGENYSFFNLRRRVTTPRQIGLATAFGHDVMRTLFLADCSIGLAFVGSTTASQYGLGGFVFAVVWGIFDDLAARA